MFMVYGSNFMRTQIEIRDLFKSFSSYAAPVERKTNVHIIEFWIHTWNVFHYVIYLTKKRENITNIQFQGYN